MADVGERLSVLVVNPERMLREMEIAFLTRRGFAVRGAERLDDAAAAGERVVFLDATPLDQTGHARFAERVAAPGTGRLLLVARRAGGAAFELQRVVAGTCTSVLTAASLRAVLEAACAEVESADETLGAHGGSGLAGLLQGFREALDRLFGERR